MKDCRGGMLVAICCLLAVSNSDAARPLSLHGKIAPTRHNGGRAWGLTTRRLPSSSLSSFLVVPRGGSEAPATEEEEDDEDDEEEEDDDEEEDDGPPSKNDITSMEPLTIVIKTNVGNKAVDHSWEINAVRTRNVESIKKNVARKLPGKPPIEMIRLLQHGQPLRDDVLVDELMEEEDEDLDDEDDDEAGNKIALTLVLDIVPPVETRFSTELEEQLPDMSTADLLEAYTLTEAAIWLSSQDIGTKGEEKAADTEEEEADDNEETIATTPSSSAPSSLVSFQLRQYATALQSQLEEHLFTEKAPSLLEDPVPPAQAAAELAKQPQIKGQRIRPSAAGVSVGAPASSKVVGMKQTAQHYLNIHWWDTIRNFCLFLFFGWFGGRTVTSRALLLLGAPMCFIVQARPVKLWYKELLYTVLRNPPSILLSLMPAPQQAMLSLSDEDALKMIYGDDAPIAASIADEADKDEELVLDAMEGADEETDDDDEGEYDEEEESDEE